MLSMTKAKATAVAVALAAVTAISTAVPADARGWRRHGGGALALGIGALVAGSIWQHRHHRHRSYSYYPTYGYYGYTSPRVYDWRHHNRHHWRHGR